MKKLLIIFAVIILPSISFSQGYTYYDINELMTSNLIRTIRSADNSENYTGSPYDHDEFINGSLITVSKQIYKDVPLRLNIYNNSVEFKSGDKVLEIDTPELFEYITIGESKIQYLPYSITKKISKGYFKIIEEGEATLLARPKVLFQEATKPGAYQDAKPAAFKRTNDEIFIKVGESQAQYVKNKKSLVEILSGKEDLVSAFIKKNKIKASDINNVRKLVQYYNSN